MRVDWDHLGRGRGQEEEEERQERVMGNKYYQNRLYGCMKVSQ
jgi:hypothetical protein